MSEGGKKIREDWISKAEVLLGVGKGHMGIITYLRSQGLGPDEAKKISYDIFDEAKRRIKKSQFFYRIIAWAFIIAGFAMPIILFFALSRFVVISAAPMIGGVLLLGKLVDPPRLPE